MNAYEFRYRRDVKLGYVLRLIIALALALLFAALARAEPAGYGAASSVTCAASGSSTQVLAANYRRQSFLITNTSGGTVRLGFLTSGTATLDDTNSLQLLAGQTFGDSGSTVYIGRLVCMNNTAGTATIYAIETRRVN